MKQILPDTDRSQLPGSRKAIKQQAERSLHDESPADADSELATLLAKAEFVLSAVTHGDMPSILAGLTELACCALAAISRRGEELIELPPAWQYDGSVASAMRLLFEKISLCSPGDAFSFSEVYCVCTHLTQSVLNADFDRAFSLGLAEMPQMAVPLSITSQHANPEPQSAKQRSSKPRYTLRVSTANSL